MKFGAIILGSLALIVGTPVSAAPTIVDFNGSLPSVGQFSGVLNLDVENGQVTSGSGSITVLSFTNAPLALITTSTAGNEDNSANYPGAPVGFRANDGTDLFAYDQAYPISTNGLLFAVGTTMPEPNGSPLIGFFSDGYGGFGAQFSGNVNGQEYYNKYVLTGVTMTGVSAGAVPEPTTWAMMIIGLGLVGFGLRRRSRLAVRVAHS